MGFTGCRSTCRVSWYLSLGFVYIALIPLASQEKRNALMNVMFSADGYTNNIYYTHIGDLR